jgi:C-terminal processing protease CtpA/Prc
MMPINTFITRLKKEQVPLIIDVRLNGGGRLDHGINILAAISQHGKVFAPTTTSFRVSPRIRNVMKNITESDILRMEDHDQKVFNQIKDAISQKRGHTYSFVKRSMISATPDIGGYEEDVVVLISERCGSACNAFASLLKKSKRVKLLGMPTKGEGAGFFADSHELLKKWKWSDSLGLFKLQIPNYLFGVPGNVGETVFINSKSHLDMNLENRPVIPHVRQSFSRDDYINGSRRWFQRSLGLLLKPYKLPSSP